MRRFFARAAGAIAALMLSGAPVWAETLSDALAQAYRNSGLIEQNRAVLRAADEDVAQAVALLRPVLNYAAGITYADPSIGDNLSGSVALNADMLLYDFGRSAIGVDAAKETVLATRATLMDVENSVLLNAVNAYLGVQRSEAFVELRENNVRLLTQQLRATRDRFEVGEVTRTDVSLAEARLAAARSGLAAEQGGLALAQEQFRVAVGVYPGRLATPPRTPAIPATEDAARSIARQENPVIKQVQHQVAAAELNVEVAKRGLLPRLSGSASVGFDDDGDDSSSIGITLSGPIYQGGALTSSVRRAQAFRDQTRAQLYTSGLQVDQEVGNAYANLAVAVASIDASTRQVEASNLALEGVREEFQLGARTTLDVLDQEQELLDAQTNLVSATVDRQIAVYQVLDAMGRLSAQRLGLNVPIYDPAAYYNAVKDAPTVNVSPEGKRLDRVLRSIGKE
ncbi:MAG: TolC family outer membrane protein [Pseudomonadota bacterium]